jgi:hypothetical protein
MSTPVEKILYLVKEKLNKLDSQDFDNLPDVKIISAYNEGRINWLRKNLSGLNVLKAGDESTKKRLDDFNEILTLPTDLTVAKKDGYYLSQKLFSDYFEFKRIEFDAKSKCCEKPLKMMCFLVGESNADLYLRDEFKQPNFNWGHTFCTLEDFRLKIYTNDEFDIENVKLTYYRFPKNVEKVGVLNLDTQAYSTSNFDCEFKTDLGILFIKEAASLIAGPLEMYNQSQLNDNQNEKTN